mmetsp:Transcript_3336/g.5089  ORF Transcript_3336/g.5089 Transcript_3336/m.5089 type:complete len:265 (-) Transcript_3336:645-1439(-)
MKTLSGGRQIPILMFQNTPGLPQSSTGVSSAIGTTAGGTIPNAILEDLPGLAVTAQSQFQDTPRLPQRSVTFVDLDASTQQRSGAVVITQPRHETSVGLQDTGVAGIRLQRLFKQQNGLASMSSFRFQNGKGLKESRIAFVILQSIGKTLGGPIVFFRFTFHDTPLEPRGTALRIDFEGGLEQRSGPPKVARVLVFQCRPRRVDVRAGWQLGLFQFPRGLLQQRPSRPDGMLEFAYPQQRQRHVTRSVTGTTGNGTQKVRFGLL